MTGTRGFAVAGWCGDPECEANVKEETGATIRCLPFKGHTYGSGVCLGCSKEDVPGVIFARAY